LQLAALLPEQKVLMAFDLVFSPNEHVFTVVDHFDHWMIILESLKALQGYDTITIGHDTPVHRSAIDSTITYVKRAKEIHAASADAKNIQREPKGRFPRSAAGRLGRFLREPSLRRAPLNAASRRHHDKGRTDKKENEQ